MLNTKYIITSENSKGNEDNIVILNNYRITVITGRLFRIEKDKKANFLDEPTQTIWYRNHGKIDYKVEYSKNKVYVTIKTKECTLKINTRIYSYKIEYFDEIAEKVYKATNLNINKKNLKGTRRTLDGVIGSVKLNDGILSKRGIASLNDGGSLILKDDGLLKVRDSSRTIDEYIFAYGNNYQDAITDFYKLTGKNPLLPRYALGNWWSRYHEYTDVEYLTLMKKFASNNVPFTVATIDMDWHLTKIPKSYGRGWTGYTWNRELFKNPNEFLKELKSLGYKITLNLHPADGIRAYEDAYEKMADYLNVDKTKKLPIKFDLTSPQFINAYFEILHRPLEEMGVDFWWIDWQQGKKSSIKNLDPLWLLNHYHTLDFKNTGKRPLILSRYAGVGSHRYQIGFSGDTMIGWKMLDFMPYFTHVASNIGFGWWSHDIGGHHFGKKDGELYLRWLQLGVFSPILRLHSTKNPFIDKDPFKYRKDICDSAIEYLRLRQQLVPYIYTMNYLNHTKDLQLCRPIYYEYKDNKFYLKKYRNMFLFGTELVVAPITRKAEKIDKSDMSYVDTYLPVGKWTDIFTGFEYEGGKNIRIYRNLYNIPVFAKKGAILPIDPSFLATKNPTMLEIKIFPGESNSFVLYEDNGEDDSYLQGKFVKTEISLNGNETNFDLVIKHVEGVKGLIPKSRIYKIVLFNVIDANVEVNVNNKTNQIKKTDCETGIVITVPATANGDIAIKIENAKYRKFSKIDYIYSVYDNVYSNVTVKNKDFKNYKKRGSFEASKLMNGIKKETDNVINME